MLCNCLKERKNNIVKNERFRIEAFERFELNKSKYEKDKRLKDEKATLNLFNLLPFFIYLWLQMGLKSRSGLKR